MHARRLALAAACLAALLAPSAHAAIVDETYSVPIVGGARISVEVQRDDKFPRQPIILTYSPYNTLSENPGGTIADDGIAAAYNPKGYARAVADVIGTRNSTGCWDYGGPYEQQSGVDVVNYLASQPWSNGKVGMIGGSYDGTTANMVAARGDDAWGLAAIVLQSAINHWYGYAYQDGARYFANSYVPTDEGIDTPLGFDWGLARTPPTKPDQASIMDLPTGRYNPCQSIEHTKYGYDTTPDYNGFWKDRDYRKDAANIRVPILVTHGWQDYNVKQSEGLDMYESAVNSPLRMLYMFQGTHEGPPSAYAPILARFWDYTLKGVKNGLEKDPLVYSQGRTGTTPGKIEPQDSWPPKHTKDVAFQLGRGAGGATLGPTGSGADATFTDLGTTSEEAVLKAGPAQESSWLYSQSAPLTQTTRIAGSQILDTVITDSSDHGQLSPTLLDVAPDGSASVISRGHMNLQYRDGLAFAQTLTPGEPTHARVRLAPQDQTIPAGHRIGLIFAGSNVVWAVPDLPAGNTYDVRNGTSRLLLPIVG